MVKSFAELARTRDHAMQLARACHAAGGTRAAMEYLREARRIQLAICLSAKKVVFTNEQV